MLPIALLVLVSLPFSVSSAFAGDLEPMPLCRALESIQPGDQIPVVVSGIYAVDYLYDPDELVCRLDIRPQTCVGFAPDVIFPAEFKALHDDLESSRVLATFCGVLHGPPVVPLPAFDSSVSTDYRALARNSSRKLYCGNRYGTKLVVESILSFGPVSEEVPWPRQQEVVQDDPIPIGMTLPKYPAIARNIDYEGIVLVVVTVEAGEVTNARIQFGDAVLVGEVLTNVRTWRFAPDVSTSLSVEYDFRLEKRSGSQGGNVSLEMQLPSYVRVTGQNSNF